MSDTKACSISNPIWPTSRSHSSNAAGTQPQLRLPAYLQEDAHVVELALDRDTGLLGVFDGHGGYLP